VEPFHRTRGVVVEKSDEEDAFARGDMESSDMGEAAMVPGAERTFCDVSRSTSMGVLPSLTAVVGYVLCVMRYALVMLDGVC